MGVSKVVSRNMQQHYKVLNLFVYMIEKQQVVFIGAAPKQWLGPGKVLKVPSSS